jgi:hypothetical protein
MDGEKTINQKLDETNIPVQATSDINSEVIVSQPITHSSVETSKNVNVSETTYESNSDEKLVEYISLLEINDRDHETDPNKRKSSILKSNSLLGTELSKFVSANQEASFFKDEIIKLKISFDEHDSTKIFLKLITGKSLLLTVRFSDTWLDVKKLISEKEHIPLNRIKLIMGKFILKNEDVIGNSDIKTYAYITITILKA